MPLEIIMAVNLDLDCLRTFLSIVETDSFTKAAHKVGRSQSAVSMQVKRLEQTLGGKLFNRASGALDLSDRGKALLPRAQELLKSSDELVAQMHNLQVAESIRLGVCDDFADDHLATVLEQFCKAHSAVALELTIDLSVRLLEGMDDDEFDLVVAKDPAAGPRRNHKVLAKTRLPWIVASHFRFDVSGSIPLVLFPEGSFPRGLMTDALSRAGRTWFPAVTCHSLAALKASVRAGLGVSAITHTAVGAGLRVPQELGLPSLPDIETAIFWPARPPSLGVRKLSRTIERSIPPV
jgi:DNA-binding transcriptional LysR family regulator